MRVDDFDFALPPEYIALAPADPRDSARMLVVDAEGGLVGFPRARIAGFPAARRRARRQ